MNSPNGFPEAGSELFQTRCSPESGSRIRYLLAGLERQKEELGPIADELIGLLHQLGVANAARHRTER